MQINFVVLQKKTYRVIIVENEFRNLKVNVKINEFFANFTFNHRITRNTLIEKTVVILSLPRIYRVKQNKIL